MDKNTINAIIDKIGKLKEDKPIKEIRLNKYNIKKVDKKFKDLLNDMKLDEFFTKFDNKQKKYNKFINSVVPEANFNMMADLLILPETTAGYKYLLVVLDLATNLFDIEPMKTKEATECLEAYKNIIKRNILKLPKISIRTDNGNEFKGSFDEYLKTNKIFHKWAYPYNHKQQAPVEGLNNILSRLLNDYMNNKTMELKKKYLNWTDVLPLIRRELNKYRERDLEKLKLYQEKYYFSDLKAGVPDFKIGDVVHYRLFQPHDIEGLPINDKGFRQGDRRISIDTRKIIKILYYPDDPYYRYLLSGIPNVSFSKYDLKLSEKKDETYLVKKIIGKRIVKKKVEYLIWWKKYLKKESTWEGKKELIEDGLEDYIDQYEKELKYI